MPDKFNNSKDYLKALNKKKFYYFTNFMFVQKICENVELRSFGMKSMLHKDKITIIFNEKEKDELTFFNNTTGLIEKSLLKSNSNSELSKKEPCNNYEFNLIKIYIFYLIIIYN